MPNGRSHSQPGSVYRQRILRLDPNRIQASALARACGTRRWAYNWALEQQKQAYAARGRFLGPAEQMRSIVRLKRTPEYAWLKQVSKCAPAAAIQDLHQALLTYLLRPKPSRLGFPRFKKKGVCRESVRLHGSIAIVAGRISLPRIGKVRGPAPEPGLPGQDLLGQALFELRLDLGGDAAESPGVRLPGLRPGLGSRPQRGFELEVVGSAAAGRRSRRREGGDSKRLWSQGKTRPASGG